MRKLDLTSEDEIMATGHNLGLFFVCFTIRGIPTGIQTQLPQIHLQQVAHLSMTQHRNLVNLLGYCQEGGYQILVLEYLPNEQCVITCMGCAICMGSAPPVVHRNFKTGNVLVDENFIAKVADARISRLLKEISHDAAGPSHSIQPSPFIDPECMGQPLVPTLQLNNFVDSWLQMTSSERVPVAIGSSVNDSVMVLYYGHKAPTS
nr:putative serine/threonine-protein kinase [Ipomoea batatas]